MSLPSKPRTNRRQWFQGTTASMAGAGLAGMTAKACQGADESISTLYVNDDVDRALQRGVNYFVGSIRTDGAIVDNNGGHHVAMTSLAIMAMASVGIQPGHNDVRSRVMALAIDFVLDERHQDATGYFGNSDASRMYGHGIITLMLTEMMGMGATIDQNKRIHAALEKAIKLILKAQAVRKPAKLAGGWRYNPTATDSDLSVSVWQLMALRSAKNDGMNVPSNAIESAISYLEHSYTEPKPSKRAKRDLLPGRDVPAMGGFSYTPGHHHPTFTMTAAGLLAMQVCGQYDSPMVRGAAQWLLQNPPRTKERFFYYGVYYYAQGMHQAGGKFAKAADTLVPKFMIGMQEASGSWLANNNEERNQGRIYSTALAMLSLSVRYHYLPIYQR